MIYEIKVLDKGFVRLLESHFSFKQIQELKEKHNLFLNKNSIDLTGAAGMTLAIKAPVFVSMQLAKYGLTNIGSIIDPKLDYMKIQLDDLKEISLETRQMIIDEMSVISDGLMKAPDQFIAKGCHSLTSQINLPISTYSTIAMTGSTRAWIGFVESELQSIFIQKYQAAVKDILKAEFFT